MINSFIKNIVFGLAKLHVVQSIPGRLTLKVDGLEIVKYFFKENEDIPVNFQFYKLSGIKNIEYSPHTSKILIEYDPALLSDSQVLNCAKRLHELIKKKAISGNLKIDQQLIDEIGSALIEEGYTFKG